MCDRDMTTTGPAAACARGLLVVLAAAAVGLRAACPAGARAVAAAGEPSAHVSAAFEPERLGQATTISFAVTIDAAGAQLPGPLSAVEVSYPADLGLATSGLGLEACDPAALEAQGASACPADSKMGQGSALVEIAYGPDVVRETVSLGIYAIPSNDGYIHLAVLAEGKEPVLAQLVLQGVLLPGRLRLSVPPLPSLPGAPGATVTAISATLGGALTYYESARGRTIAYRPRGIGLPSSCPRGGFKLGARLTFEDGQRSRARTVIPCPR